MYKLDYFFPWIAANGYWWIWQVVSSTQGLFFYIKERFPPVLRIRAHVDADPDTEPACHFDVYPYPDPEMKWAQLGSYSIHFLLSHFYWSGSGSYLSLYWGSGSSLSLGQVPDPTFQFDADPDPHPEPHCFPQAYSGWRLCRGGAGWPLARRHGGSQWRGHRPLRPQVRKAIFHSKRKNTVRLSVCHLRFNVGEHRRSAVGLHLA